MVALLWAVTMVDTILVLGAEGGRSTGSIMIEYQDSGSKMSSASADRGNTSLSWASGRKSRLSRGGADRQEEGGTWEW